MHNDGLNGKINNELDYQLNDISINTLKNLSGHYKNENHINLENLQQGMTLEDLKKEFQKFSGNYSDVLAQFSVMNEREQKLFILYSMFYFGQYFYIENIESIITEELFEQTRKLAFEFTKYGSQTGCDIKCHLSVDGPAITGIGYNVTGDLKSKYYIRNIDDLNIEILAKIANSGYSYRSEEEAIFQSLNEKRTQEKAEFQQLLESLLNTKVNF